jgi:SAM-dependent methyltransferase
MLSLIKPGWPDEARMLVQLPILARLVRAVPLTGRCLNAGCGEGLYCRFIEGFQGVTEIMNVDLHGTDRLLTRLSDPRHRATDASLTDLPFPDGSFDSCLCTEVLEHVADDNAAVRELARCVRPGGTLLVSVPHPPAPYDPSHVREGYRLAELTSLLGQHGLAVVASSRCFGLAMRLMMRLWRWQYHALGHRSLMPRGIIRCFGYLDHLLPIGPGWDLVVVGVKK